MNNMITTEQVTKKYKSFLAVDHISLHIRKGSIYGLLGPNGAGKSTTMKMLLGLTAPTEGMVTIDGKQFPADRIAILKEIGSLIEAPSFYANLTGRENLDIIRRILELPQSAVEDALELVSLSEFGDRLAKEYSLGMKQRLGLAVLVSSHILTEIERMADDIGILNHGRLLFEGSLDELRQHALRSGFAADHLEDMFLSMIEKDNTSRKERNN